MTQDKPRLKTRTESMWTYYEYGERIVSMCVGGDGRHYVFDFDAQGRGNPDLAIAVLSTYEEANKYSRRLVKSK